MGAIFKKTTTRYLLDGKHVSATTPGATKKQVEGKKWVGQWVDEVGRTRTKALSTDKGVAASMLAKIEADVERRKLGVIDTFTDGASVPLASHLDDYLANIANDGATALHVATERARIERCCKACGFIEIKHLDATKLGNWLAKEMKKRTNFGAVTRNHHLRAIKSFVQWMVDHHKAKANPFTSLKPLNTEVEEARHARRALNEADFKKLLETTRTSKRVDGKRSPDWRFDGEQRYHLYLTAAYTGLRASELASLKASSFDFEEGTLVVQAGYSKHRQKDTLPLLPELGEVLQAWFDARSIQPKEHLWAGSWAARRRAGQILKRDLKEAGIAYEDENGEVFDFHCLRVQFATMLVRAKTYPKDAQDLMRHSDINLTMSLYAKLKVDELAPELAKLKLPK